MRGNAGRYGDGLIEATRGDSDSIEARAAAARFAYTLNVIVANMTKGHG